MESEIEERCVSLVASLFTNLGPKGGRRERVGSKFVENEFEKADRLLEIYFRQVCVQPQAPAGRARPRARPGHPCKSVTRRQFMLRV